MTGHELKERRTKLGLSQEELARSLDVALSTVARWEQLRDEEIPNAGMLQLALQSLANGTTNPDTAPQKKRSRKVA